MLLGSSGVTYSQSPDTLPAKNCSDAWTRGVDIIKAGLEQQEKNQMDALDGPVSEEFETIKGDYFTGYCMEQYLCDSVLYSGLTEGVDTYGTGLTSKNLGYRAASTTDELTAILQGKGVICDAPEILMKELSKVGWKDKWKTVLNNDKIQTNGYTVIPQCFEDYPGTPGTQAFANTQMNYSACKEYVDKLYFSFNPDAPESEQAKQLGQQSPMFQVMINNLKRKSAEQVSGALEKKLLDITKKMDGMVSHATYFSAMMNKLNQKTQSPECLIYKCD
jgi:hypothetical protein